MRFGVCGSVTNAAMLKAAGWDYIEENVQEFLRGEVGDAEWDGAAAARQSVLPVEAGNVLMPARLRIVGPSADLRALREYMTRILARAEKAEMKTLVFGSGKARFVDDGLDRAAARTQILDFVRMSAEVAAVHGVTLVAEPLQRGECNILNSVAEAMDYVRTINHPHFQCLVDSYHFWEEAEPLENLRAAMPWIKHVHVADRKTRLAPGQTQDDQTARREADYLAFFKVLKTARYDARISVEGSWKPAIEHDAAAVLQRLKSYWAKA